MFVRPTQAYSFICDGCAVLDCTQRPFSSKKPFREEHPGPPFNQIVISFTGAPSFGWKTKNSFRDGSSFLMGICPEYSSPTGNGISGSEVT